MCEQQRRKQILYDVFDDDDDGYLIVCEQCATQYNSNIRPVSSTLELAEEARRAKERCRECEVCGHVFTDGGSR